MIIWIIEEDLRNERVNTVYEEKEHTWSECVETWT